MKSLLVFTALLLTFAAQAKVKLGNEVLIDHHFKELAGKRVGLITNPSGVNRDLKTTIEILRAAPNVKLVALFGAEHGVYGDVEAGKHVTNNIDPLTGLNAFSLYRTNGTSKPTKESLKDIDVLVYDLQDIGCRSYTFITAMGFAMQACAENNIEFVVLDRPNPLGGDRIEGAMLQKKFRSTVSEWYVPYIYGLTCGELARMINGEHWNTNQCKLTVVPMKGWKRSMIWSDTGLQWVPASPHIPNADSPLYCAATGIVGELLSVNIGVGYTMPFHCIAVPGADMHKVADALNSYQVPGTFFKPVSYKPYYNTHSNKVVYGAQLYITDPKRAPLVPINLYAIETLKKTANFDVFEEATKAKRKFGMFDKVNGTDTLREQLQAGKPDREIVESWKPDIEQIRKARKKYLLY
ncbi:MAG: hypothetical protein JWO95_54 [Verrucomicrobiales bacterium]|nr:hypothetical protein [Verrucomicrobiales bacterium]